MDSKESESFAYTAKQLARGYLGLPKPSIHASPDDIVFGNAESLVRYARSIGKSDEEIIQYYSEQGKVSEVNTLVAIDHHVIRDVSDAQLRIAMFQAAELQNANFNIVRALVELNLLNSTEINYEVLNATVMKNQRYQRRLLEKASPSDPRTRV